MTARSALVQLEVRATLIRLSPIDLWEEQAFSTLIGLH